MCRRNNCHCYCGVVPCQTNHDDYIHPFLFLLSVYFVLNVFHTGSIFFLASYIKDNFNGNHLVNTVFYKVLANLS